MHKAKLRSFYIVLIFTIGKYESQKTLNDDKEPDDFFLIRCVGGSRPAFLNSCSKACSMSFPFSFLTFDNTAAMQASAFALGSFCCLVVLSLFGDPGASCKPSTASCSAIL